MTETTPAVTYCYVHPTAKPPCAANAANVPCAPPAPYAPPQAMCARTVSAHIRNPLILLNGTITSSDFSLPAFFPV